MKNDKPYLDPTLSLAKLGDMLNLSSKEVSQMINQIKGINYSKYVNQYRINEAKTRLTSEKYAHYTIAAIAYDCGFNSISSFNAIFKKNEGLTAKTYRSSNL